MAVALVVVIADQVTKLAIIEYIDHYAKVPLTSFINLTHQKNYGAAFSFLAGAGGWQRWFFIALSSTVSVALIVWLLRLGRGERWLALALALVLSGAAGNLIDRIVHGHVIDFIQLYYRQWYWPAFNVADSAITVGAVLLVALSLFARK